MTPMVIPTTASRVACHTTIVRNRAQVGAQRHADGQLLRTLLSTWATNP